MPPRPRAQAGLSRPPTVRGFVLQPTYRIESGRPVVHLYGTLEEGRPFLVRDTRRVPHFYVEIEDAEAARQLGARQQRPTDRLTLTGQPVVRVEVAAPADVPPIRDRLVAAGIACHEADLRFATRYLIDHGIRGALEIRGEAHTVPGLGLVFEDPEIAPADWTPRLSVLSLDIETDPSARRLLAVGLHGCGVSEVLLLTAPGWSCPEGALPFPSEPALLGAFARRVRELDPDVLTGWNVVDFDLSVLARIAERLRVRLELGRGPGALRVRALGASRGTRQASVPGRLVLDGIQLLRGAFIRMDDYGLDAVARSVLGEGKTLEAGGDKAEQILRLYQEDRPRFVEYNRTDARLALEIVERLRLVELAVERSRLTGLPPDRVASSIAAFDFLYLSKLGQRRLVAPSVHATQLVEPQAGGHVLDPLPGLYTNVVVLDFRSLYPSLIRTFEIDPLNLLRPESGAAADPIVAPNGASFSRSKGILSELLDELMSRREEARRAGDQIKSHAIKILMNSFYGVLGTPACRFYDPRLANAITGFGRELLLWCKERIEADARRVLYGDTDSLFVESGVADAVAARAFGEDLAARLNRELAAHVSGRWRVESRLKLVFDRLYLRLCLPAIRHGTAGARKRYAGLVDTGNGRRVVFTGLEAVRGDWTELAKEVQRELYARLFADQPVEAYLREVVVQLRAGQLDDKLVYRKTLRKPPEAYTATTPPHVRAARKEGRRRGRVAYLITTAGPQPVEGRSHPLDYEHYLDKQVRPVAEPVLTLLGLEFAQVVDSKGQLPLF